LSKLFACFILAQAHLSIPVEALTALPVPLATYRFTDAPPGTRSAEFKAALRAKFVEQVGSESATVWQRFLYMLLRAYVLLQVLPYAAMKVRCNAVEEQQSQTNAPTSVKFC
jgi:hypothetical protein